jgi:hypothetical protein
VGLQQCNVLWVNIFENILIQAIPFANIRRFSGPCFAEILASFWTFLCDFREHYDNIVFTSTFSEHFRDPFVLYHTDPVSIFFCSEKIKLFLSKKGYRKTFSQTFEGPQQCKMLWVNILILSSF